MVTAPDLQAGHLVRVLPDYRRDGADFNVLLPSRQQIPIAVTAFVEFATERILSLVPGIEDLPAAPQRRKR